MNIGRNVDIKSTSLARARLRATFEILWRSSTTTFAVGSNASGRSMSVRASIILIGISNSNIDTNYISSINNNIIGNNNNINNIINNNIINNNNNSYKNKNNGNNNKQNIATLTLS